MIEKTPRNNFSFWQSWV